MVHQNKEEIARNPRKVQDVRDPSHHGAFARWRGRPAW